MTLHNEFLKYIEASHKNTKYIKDINPDDDNDYLDESFNPYKGLLYSDRPFDPNQVNKKTEFIYLDSTDENIYKDYYDFLYRSDDPLPINFLKKNMFDIKYYQKRGRVPNKNALDEDKSFMKKKHMRNDFDNIQTKIQVHFTNFLINLTNDVITAEFKYNNKFFKPISYKVKKQIKSDYLKKIFQEPIKNIIQEDISLKFKNFRPDYNKDLYAELSKKSQWFCALLELKYIDVFNRYYFNNEKRLESIEFNGKKINVSKKTKSYYDLLNKEKVLEKEIKNIVEIVYLSPYKNKTFIISKNDN